MADALGGKSLFSIYAVFEKMKERSMPAKPATPPAGPSSGSTPAATTTPTATAGPSEADKKNADALKAQGNAAMAKKDFAAAVDYYTQALALAPKNTIYLSNRAAAYSSLGQHEKAIEDAQVAVDEDPTYTKAWSRLGLARFAVGDARGSMEAYKAGIEAEGNGGSEIMKNGYTTAKKRVEEEDAESATGSGDATRSGSPPAGGAPGGMPDLASLASMFGGGRGGPGGGGGGGMPDLSSIMNNPMFAQMAQNVMSNPALMQNMMNNPRVREMMDSFGGGGGDGEGRGGGMPDLGSLMQDPSIADLSVSPPPSRHFYSKGSLFLTGRKTSWVAALRVLVGALVAARKQLDSLFISPPHIFQ